MDYTPRCPHCSADLEYSNFTHGELDGNFAYFDAEGYCIHCGRKYKWEEVYEIVETRNYVEIWNSNS